MMGQSMKAQKIGMRAAALVAGVMASSAMAATYTWTGTTSGNWSDAAKWDANGVPVTDGTADIVFSAGGGTTSTINSAWATSGSINSLTLTAAVTSGNVALSNGSGVTGLTIGAGGIQSLSASRSFNQVNIGTLTLAASQEWNIVGGELRFNTTNLASASGVVVTKKGAGGLSFLGGSSSAFQGSFVLNQGGVTFGNASTLGNLGTQTLTVGNLGSTTLLIGFNGNGTYSQAVNLQNDSYNFQFNFNNTPGHISTITLSGNLSGNLNGGSSGNALDQMMFGSSYVSTSRSNVWRITGNNSGLTTTNTLADLLNNGKYPVHIRRGYVVLDSANALGANNSLMVTIGDNYVPSQGKDPGGTNAAAGSGFISALLATNGNTVNAPIRYRHASSSYAGNVSPGIGILGLEGTGSVNFNGNIYMNSATDAKGVGTLQLTAETGGTAIFNGVISDTGSENNTIQANKARLMVMGLGTAEVNGNNTYLGSSSVRSGSLVIGHNNALGGASSSVTLGESSSVLQAVKVATTSQPGGTYSHTTKTLTFGSAVASIDGVTLADNDRILIHNQGYNPEQNGIYVRTSATVWTRAGDLDDAGEFAYGQQVAVQSGTTYGGKTFYLTNRTDVAPVTPGYQGISFGLDYLNPDASILLKSGITLSRNINVMANGSTGKSILGGNTADLSTFSGLVTLNKALTVTAASGGQAIFSNDITGSFGINKEGSGKVSFDGNKSYTGVTAVTAGVLEVNGQLASTQVDILAAGTLAGSGNLAGVVVSNGGTLSPGNSPGTMTIAGLTLDAASNLNYDLAANDLTIGNGINDLININGNVTLAGTLNVAVYSGTELSLGTYRLMNYTGTLTNNTLQLAGGLSNTRTYQIDTNTAGQVNLVVSAIPEPASLGLLALGSVLVAGRPRPRKFVK